MIEEQLSANFTEKILQIDNNYCNGVSIKIFVDRSFLLKPFFLNKEVRQAITFFVHTLLCTGK